MSGASVTWPRSPLARAHPLIGNHLRARDVVDDEDQLMIVIAVLHLDVHAGIGHATRDLAELSRLALPQPDDHNVVLSNDADSRRLERLASRRAILEQKVRDAFEDAAAFDAHTGAAEGFAQPGEGAGPV